MNRISQSVAAMIMLTAVMWSCSSSQPFDAQGTFETTEVTVSSEGTGQIISLTVNEGDSVRQGETLGMIDTLQLYLQKCELRQQFVATMSSRPDIRAQKAAIEEQILGATTERDRLQRLFADGASTQQQLDNANTRLATLQAELLALQSTLAINTKYIDEKSKAIMDQIAAIDERIRRCTISAPISGVVLTKIAEAGEVAGYGTPLLRIGDMEQMYLRAYFTSDQLAGLQLGQSVEVVADYGGSTTYSYPGKITFISSTSEFTPKTIQTKDSRANLVYAVKIAVPNDGKLKIGLSGNVYLNAGNSSK